MRTLFNIILIVFLISGALSLDSATEELSPYIIYKIFHSWTADSPKVFNNKFNLKPKDIKIAFTVGIAENLLLPACSNLPYILGSFNSPPFPFLKKPLLQYKDKVLFNNEDALTLVVDLLRYTFSRRVLRYKFQHVKPLAVGQSYNYSLLTIDPQPYNEIIKILPFLGAKNLSTIIMYRMIISSIQPTINRYVTPNTFWHTVVKGVIEGSIFTGVSYSIDACYQAAVRLVS